jgi:hypothetical protein
MAAVQIYSDISLFSVPSSCTFITGPSRNITGSKLYFSRSHDLLGFSVVLFPVHSETDEWTVKWQTVFLCFFLPLSLYYSAQTFSHDWTNPVGIDLPSVVPRSQSVGFLWTIDRPVAETTWQHTTLTGGTHPCRRWDSNLLFQQVSFAVPHLRPHGQWNRPFTLSCHGFLTLRCNTELTGYCQSVPCTDITHSHEQLKFILCVCPSLLLPPHWMQFDSLKDHIQWRLVHLRTVPCAEQNPSYWRRADDTIMISLVQ